MATVNITPLVEFNWHDYQTQTKQFYGPQKPFLNLTDMYQSLCVLCIFNLKFITKIKSMNCDRLCAPLYYFIFCIMIMIKLYIGIFFWTSTLFCFPYFLDIFKFVIYFVPSNIFLEQNDENKKLYCR